MCLRIEECMSGRVGDRTLATFSFPPLPGGFFDGADANDTTSSLSPVLNLAVTSVVDDRHVLNKAGFASVVSRIAHPGETLRLHNKVCSDLGWSNATAFVGPSSAAGAAHMAAFAAALHVPAFETRWNPERGRPRNRPPVRKSFSTLDLCVYFVQSWL